MKSFNKKEGKLDEEHWLHSELEVIGGDFTVLSRWEQAEHEGPPRELVIRVSQKKFRNRVSRTSSLSPYFIPGDWLLQDRPQRAKKIDHHNSMHLLRRMCALLI